MQLKVPYMQPGDRVGVPFPAKALSIQLLGIEQLDGSSSTGIKEIIKLEGSNKRNIKEIIQLSKTFADWTESGNGIGPETGIHELPFSIDLPEWLPDSLLCGEPDEEKYMRVEYRLTAQLIPYSEVHWAGELP